MAAIVARLLMGDLFLFEPGDAEGLIADSG
jgi:hypothetical protein